MKDTLCCVIRRNFTESVAVRLYYSKIFKVIGMHDFLCYVLMHIRHFAIIVCVKLSSHVCAEDYVF